MPLWLKATPFLGGMVPVLAFHNRCPCDEGQYSFEFFGRPGERYWANSHGVIFCTKALVFLKGHNFLDQYSRNIFWQSLYDGELMARLKVKPNPSNGLDVGIW
jgi:hypothetical protein